MESFTYQSPGSVVITSPLTGDGAIGSPMPTVAYSVVGMDQDAVEIEIERREGSIWVPHWLFPKLSTPEVVTVSVPADDRLQEGHEYRLTVRVWDQHDRAIEPGFPSFFSDSVTFSLQPLSV